MGFSSEPEPFYPFLVLIVPKSEVGVPMDPSLAGLRCDLHCRNGHQVDCSGADLGSGSPDGDDW